MKIKETVRHVSIEEAVAVMANDNIDFIEMHKGYFMAADLPFRPPLHVGAIIVWPPVDIHPSAKIGEGVVIGRYTNICGPIEIGAHTRIQGFCFIPDNIKIGERVFIGPNVTFTNVKRPRIRENAMKIRDGVTIVEDDANIGAGVVICPGIKIGARSLIGAGAVVTKDVPPDTIVIGCPAVNYSGK